MDEQPVQVKTFTLKQKLILYFYRCKQYLNLYWSKFKKALSTVINSSYFYIIIFCIALFLLHKQLVHLNLTLAPDYLSSLGFTIAGIIGASIAIIFSFSTFILQSTADLFSTQYLNKFIQDKKEKYIFWSLTMLTFTSFLVPIFVHHIVVEILIAILFVAFLLIYSLYKELRERINPETTLTKIRDDAFLQLRNINKDFLKQAKIQNKIFEYKEADKNLTVAVQYKSIPNWNTEVLENVKYLYEIGLRLLSKNEIHSFNLTLKYIFDIYLLHLGLRNNQIMRVPAGLWGAYTFEDEGFTTTILEYLESISNRIIHDKRKENIYYFLSLYEQLIKISQYIGYADKSMGSAGENPILSLILSYYIGLTDKLSLSKERDWIWESTKSLSRVSSLLLSKEYNHFNYSQIVQAIDNTALACVSSKESESFIKEIVNIYFSQIIIGWNKYPSDDIFWNDLFKNLKKTTLVLSLLSGVNLSLSELFINFHGWQANMINAIMNLEDAEKQVEFRSAYTSLMKRWSDFLLDLARDMGLEGKQIGFPIIQSVQNNLRILYGIKKKFNSDLGKLYRTQFNIFSWYFHKTEHVDESFLFNLEQIQETLLLELNNNLNNKVFEVKPAIELYIQLVKNHFSKAKLGYGYNHPRIINKLLPLGLILTKYKIKTNGIIKLIENMNQQYLVLNKEHFELKAKEPMLMGPDEYQLCKEIHDLENDIFSYNSVRMGIIELLASEVTKTIWDKFIGQIEYCRGVRYTTTPRF